MRIATQNLKSASLYGIVIKYLKTYPLVMLYYKLYYRKLLVKYILELSENENEYTPLTVTIFDPNPHIVTQVKGTMITASRNKPPHTFTRNISAFKRINMNELIKAGDLVQPAKVYSFVLYIRRSTPREQRAAEKLNSSTIEKRTVITTKLESLITNATASKSTTQQHA